MTSTLVISTPYHATTTLHTIITSHTRIFIIYLNCLAHSRRIATQSKAGFVALNQFKCIIIYAKIRESRAIVFLFELTFFVLDWIYIKVCMYAKLSHFSDYQILNLNLRKIFNSVRVKIFKKNVAGFIWWRNLRCWIAGATYG